VNAQAWLDEYVVDLNNTVESREFPPFVKKWYAPDGKLRFHHEETGIDKARRLWTQLLPTAQANPRQVIQFVHKIDGGRVYTFRELVGGDLPVSLWNLQESVFNDKTLISELAIYSATDKPELEPDEAAQNTRLGRIFMAFADVFNDFFKTGNDEPLVEWCDPNIKMILDNQFQGMDVIKSLVRIAPTTRFKVDEFEQPEDNHIKALFSFENWGGRDGLSPWDVVLDEQGKMKQITLALQLRG
jgi:hypothetical protein